MTDTTSNNYSGSGARLRLAPEVLEDRLTALGESEMELFRFLLDKPAGVILTADTDKMLADLLEADGLLEKFPEGDAEGVRIPRIIRKDYELIRSDEMTLRWRKRNWMYKCLEAGKYLYGVMTWEVLKDLFGLWYPHAEMDEIRELFNTTPVYYQWFTERNGRLVLNGYEQDNYYIYLEQQIQRGIPYYKPTRQEVEELYEKGCLLSGEAHAKMLKFITETYGCDEDMAGLKVHELYDAVNNQMRVNDAAEMFASGGENGGSSFAFPSDEAHVKFIELFMEMSRECRVRQNRGHDSYEMIAIMAERSRNEAADAAGSKTVVKRVKIGRNDPCPCGSGKKYKNCCGRN
ncbi:MAG: SEC-C domain-containing protein [Mogibacterium sp.]|nr:SEC-C domain-containing protein [Mogibacterium sp.]